MKEKVQLSLVLSRKAKIYIFDEPIAGVDPAARDVIFELIMNSKREDATIIICTHLISEVENILDYAIFLKNGVVTLRNDVHTIKETSGKTLNEIFKEVYHYASIS
jgi:ABC-2 type transport system ATP-binding protein